MDNQIYGMTKGQTAPTSFVGFRTKTTPYGSVEAPVDPVWAALTMGATFVAQTGSFDPKQLRSLILKGLQHKGMAFINVLSPCITFNTEGDKNFYKEHSFPIEEGHDPTDFGAAVKLVMDEQAKERFALGVIYKTERPIFDEQMEDIIQLASDGTKQEDLNKIAKQFL
jgi:2-oxoglutarate ferredoxin oxidoreductase subunit beta